MAPKGNHHPDRLKKRSDFLRLQQTGRKWVSPTVIVQAGDALAVKPRIGLTATKKLGGAVTRNRIKRRLREAAREVLAKNTPATSGPAVSDYVLIGRTETATCDFKALVRDLAWCIRRLETKNEKPSGKPA